MLDPLHPHVWQILQERQRAQVEAAEVERLMRQLREQHPDLYHQVLLRIGDALVASGQKMREWSQPAAIQESR